MSLTGYVPDLIKEDFNILMNKALQNAHLTREEISHWCIHPGGKKILETIEQSTGLKAGHFQYSYDILREYGNMSSPTVLFVLERILQEIESKPYDSIPPYLLPCVQYDLRGQMITVSEKRYTVLFEVYFDTIRA